MAECGRWRGSGAVEDAAAAAALPDAAALAADEEAEQHHRNADDRADAGRRNEQPDPDHDEREQQPRAVPARKRRLPHHPSALPAFQFHRSFILSLWRGADAGASFSGS